MDYIGIEIGRDWAWSASWEEEGWVWANDGSSQGKIVTDYWEDRGQEHLIKMGKALRRFPKKVPGQYSREVREKADFPYFVLRAHADNPEHIFLEIILKSRAEEERCISFTVEPSAIHRLGELLLEFSKWERHSFKYHILRWSPNPNNDELVEFELSKREQPKVERPQMDPAMKEWERLKRKHPTPEERAKKKDWISRGPSDWWNFPHV